VAQKKRGTVSMPLNVSLKNLDFNVLCRKTVDSHLSIFSCFPVDYEPLRTF
jgi:hypothetical protein